MNEKDDDGGNKCLKRVGCWRIEAVYPAEL